LVSGVLAFALTLLLAVLVSGLAHRSVLSTAVLFLGAGFLIGEGGLGLMSVQPGDPLVRVLAELALFSVLFTDGMRVGIRDLRAAWRLPGQALLLGMPLTLGLTALLAHLVVGLPWAESFLLGAALSPTDPVFAAAIVGREDVPHRLRQLLNVESGLNDGLALPVVVVLLAVVAGSPTDVGQVLVELAGGVALGIAVPWAAIRIERIPFLSAATAYEPLNAFAIGLVVFALSSITHANAFLAAFAAGITVASTSEEVRAVLRGRRARLRRWIDQGVRAGELQPVPANALAAMLLALGDGLLLHAGLDPAAFTWPNIHRAVEVLMEGMSRSQ
jgi:NhaP-type Na+/H+ or K+/H+ antiporter